MNACNINYSFFQPINNSRNVKKGYSEGFENLAKDAYDRYTGNTGI